jgi:arginine deiminase
VILPGGVERASVSRIDLTDPDLHWEPANDLLTTLGELGLPMEPIPCGGNDAVAQQREQWTDGANAFAVSPGVIFLFDRNRRTATELERRGFEIVEAEQLLLGQRELNIEDPDVGRVCILLKSHEISRARGGPHCLIHPLVRDDL